MPKQKRWNKSAGANRRYAAQLDDLMKCDCQDSIRESRSAAVAEPGRSRTTTVNRTNNNQKNTAHEKRRKEKPAQVEHHPLAHRDGIARFFQYRVRVHQVSLADNCPLAAHWTDAGLQQDAYPSHRRLCGSTTAEMTENQIS